MPWCPKCKNEYKAGVKVCTDCGCELTEEKTEELVPLTFGTEEEMQTLRDFLVYSKIESSVVMPGEGETTFELHVSEKEANLAKKLTALFLSRQAGEAASAGAAGEPEVGGKVQAGGNMQAAGKARNGGEEPPEPAGVYEDSAQKAEDNRSSGILLLAVGIVGTAVMLLCMTGVIPVYLNATTGYMVYGVMSALFILFIVMGAISMRSSKIFAKKAESENSLRSTIEKWCLENLSAEELDREAFGDSAQEVPDEMKYFMRTDLVKRKIQAQFMNLDLQFLEHFTDSIYEDIFEEN